MTKLSHSYLTPDGTKLEDVRDGIRAHDRFGEEPPHSMTRTCFGACDRNENRALLQQLFTPKSKALTGI